MTKIRSIACLLSATKNAGPLLERANVEHVRNIQERLRTGIETTGNPFAPFKDPSRATTPRPLYYAARLFEGAAASIEEGVDSTRSVITVRGLPAKIAHYQSARRPFLWFSDSDRREVVGKFFSSLREKLSWR